MKPYLHGLISVKKFGGKVEDYQKIHDWFDQTKAHVPDMRHRALLHNSFGIYLAEQFFGVTMTNSDGKVVSVRDIGEQHVLDDLGTIPTVQDYLTHLPMLPWLGGPKRRKGIKADEAFGCSQPPDEPEGEAAPVAPTPTPVEGAGGAAVPIDWNKMLADLQKKQNELEKAKWPGSLIQPRRPWRLEDFTGQPFPQEISVID